MISGAYEIDTAEIANQTGIDEGALPKVFARFGSVDVATYDSGSVVIRCRASAKVAPEGQPRGRCDG